MVLRRLAALENHELCTTTFDKGHQARGDPQPPDSKPTRLIRRPPSADLSLSCGTPGRTTLTCGHKARWS